MPPRHARQFVRTCVILGESTCASFLDNLARFARSDDLGFSTLAFLQINVDGWDYTDSRDRQSIHDLLEIMETPCFDAREMKVEYFPGKVYQT
jgi:hypothetical protein